MKNYICCKRAFSLIELSIAMGVMAVLASSVVPIAIRSAQIRAGEKTALEMAMIQEAGKNYFIDHHSWLIDIATLKDQGYLSSTWTAINPWNRSYQISGTNLEMKVSTDVPEEWANLVFSHLPGASIGEVVDHYRIVSSSISSPGNSKNLPSGSIIPWASSTIPEGFLLCDGHSLNVIDYPDLFEAIGNTFGGDGVNTFKLPDIRGRTIVGLNDIVNPIGDGTPRVSRGHYSEVASLGGGKYQGAFGEEAHRQTINEIAPHHHSVVGSYSSWRGGVDGVQTGPFPIHPEAENASWNTNNTGGSEDGSSLGAPSNIVQPSIAMIYIIKY